VKIQTNPGGYFIVNGTEKALSKIEDLGSKTKFLVSASSGTTNTI